MKQSGIHYTELENCTIIVSIDIAEYKNLPAADTRRFRETRSISIPDIMKQIPLEGNITEEEAAAIGDEELGVDPRTDIKSYGAAYKTILLLLVRECGMPIDGRRFVLAWTNPRNYWGRRNTRWPILSTNYFVKILNLLRIIHLLEEGYHKLCFSLVELEDAMGGLNTQTLAKNTHSKKRPAPDDDKLPETPKARRIKGGKFATPTAPPSPPPSA